MDQTSKVPLRLEFLYNDELLAIGTGFVYQYNQEYFLITNWHNVTGRDALTKKPLHSGCAIPNRMRFNFPCYHLPTKEESVNLPNDVYTLTWSTDEQPLYKDEDMVIPWWYEHPVHREKVDLVAFPCSISMTDILSANDSSLNLEKDLPLLPTLDVYILGFPIGLTGGGRFPIWKRGSLATEPYIDIDDLPKLLIDTATRQGMSGAPVYAEVTTTPSFERKTNAARIGKIRKFIGVYSGRVGNDEFQAQLGVVWKVKAIEEVIEGREVGRSSFS